MRTSVNPLFLILSLTASCLFIANCSNSSGLPTVLAPAGPTSSTALPISNGQSNIMTVTMGCGYVNEPCVTVKVCIPGTTTCQTIPNVLLDTGSYGLRLFSNITTDWTTTTPLIALPQTADPNNSANTVGECISYADGSTDWGPLATADIQMGGETASSVPVQIINSSFAQLPTTCVSPDTTAIATGFNGILGVGLFVYDCGTNCDPTQDANAANSGIYFSCPASGACTGLGLPVLAQVTNPVSYLPVDNNGVVLALTTSIPDAGLSSMSGYLVFGIGTQSNNSPSGTTTFFADTAGNFATIFNGTNLSGSFIDSGSNALYFPQSNVTPVCTDATTFFCPTSQVPMSASQYSTQGTNAFSIAFNVANADTEMAAGNPNLIFNNLAGPGGQFDWGLPFFLGRNVFVGLEGTSSSAGTGPYWAY